MVLPPGPSAPPTVQTLRWLFRPIAFMEACRRRYGDTFTVYFPGFQGPTVMISHPEAIRELYGRENGLPSVRASLVASMGPRSVILIEGEEHLAKRRLMLPAFHGERMRAYETIIEEATEREVATWPRGTAFAIHPRMQALTLEVILRAVFGVTDSVRFEQLRASLTKLLRSESASAIAQLRDALARRLGRRVRAAELERSLTADVDQLLREEIAEHRRDPELASRVDILSNLSRARFEYGGMMDDDDLRDQLMSLLLAGHETTATGLAWAFDLLLHHPAILDRLRAELTEGREEYLRAVVLESLRLRPVVSVFAGRRLGEELRLDGFVLPPGTDVTPAVWLTHTRADLYPAPLEFRPERFLDRRPSTYGWVPFGGGLRRCLGASFAELEMRIVLREVLARLDIRAARRRPETIGLRNVTFAPRGGTRVVVE